MKNEGRDLIARSSTCGSVWLFQLHHNEPLKAIHSRRHLNAGSVNQEDIRRSTCDSRVLSTVLSAESGYETLQTEVISVHSLRPHPPPGNDRPLVSPSVTDFH
ncbi:hypothetical protein J6590_051111 [Homalodisca vitripennis]|nr:hypothetical protein J6590_051111 [Homalodisca vitripennis]